MSSRFPVRAVEHRGKDPCPIPCSVPRGGGGAGWEQPGLGGGPHNKSGRRNGRLERQEVPRCGQGQALRAGAVGQPVVRIHLAAVTERALCAGGQGCA